MHGNNRNAFILAYDHFVISRNQANAPDSQYFFDVFLGKHIMFLYHPGVIGINQQINLRNTHAFQQINHPSSITNCRNMRRCYYNRAIRCGYRKTETILNSGRTIDQYVIKFLLQLCYECIEFSFIIHDFFAAQCRRNHEEIGITLIPDQRLLQPALIFKKVDQIILNLIFHSHYNV